MSPSKSAGSPKLPDWADKLPLSKKSRRMLASILHDQTKDVQDQVEGLLSLGNQVEVFLEEMRSIVKVAEASVDQSVELLNSFQCDAADIQMLVGAINVYHCDELRDVVARIERLKEIADMLKARKGSTVPEGNAVRIRAGIEGTMDALEGQSCEDRGPQVRQIVEAHYEKVRKDWPILTQENVEAFLNDFCDRAYKSVRSKRKYGPKVRKSIREDPSLRAQVSRFCHQIVLRDFSLRNVVKFSPSMLAALLRHIPSPDVMDAIMADHRNLRHLPQHSRAMVMAGTLKSDFYLDGATDQEREAQIDPAVTAACTGSTPKRVIRVEYVMDEDVFVLRDALHPKDVLETVIAKPHSLAGKNIRVRGTMDRKFEIISIDGKRQAGTVAALEEELNLHPLKVLEPVFTVQWASGK